MELETFVTKHGGLSENIIEASWQALADSIEYKLISRDPDVQKTDDS